MSNAKFKKKQFMVLGTEIYIKQHLLIIKHEKKREITHTTQPDSKREKTLFSSGHFTIEVKYR